MQVIPLLLVGDATDGPSEELVPVTSLDQAVRLFGGYAYEQIDLASGSTGYTLAHGPWASDVTPMKVAADGALSEQRLYDLAISGAVLSWSPPGDTIPGPIVFRVLTLPSGTSLVRGILDTVRAGATVFALRLGGTHGTAQGDDFQFAAVYAGARYNGTTVTITSGGTVTVTPSGGTGRVRSYQPASDAQFRQALELEVARGSGPVLLDHSPSSTAFTLPAGTYTVTGGTDGILTPDLFYDWVLANDVAGVDILCPIGLATDAVSAVVALLDGTDYPTLLVAQALASGTALTGIVNTSRYLCSVGFSVVTEAGSARARTEPAAPLVAAMLSRDAFSRTLAPLPEFPPVPAYSAAEIALVAASGHTVAYKSISRSWALWHANTGDPDWPVSAIRAYQEIARPVYETLEPVLGQTLLDLSGLNDLLATAFGRVRGSTVIDWSLALHGDTLSADIAFRPYGEVRVIQASLALGSAAAAAP